MLKQKKIMFVAQSAGGVERYLQMLFRYIDRSKYRIILVASLDYCESDFSTLVDKFYYVDMIRKLKFTSDIRAIIEVRKLIKSITPDIVYLHSSKAGAIGRIASLFCDKSHVLYNPHGWAFCMQCSEKKKILYRFVEKCLARINTDKIIAISQCEVQRAIYNKICKENKIINIVNGIDVDKYLEDRAIKKESLGIPKDSFVVGFVGRICVNKAPDVFVKAAEIISKRIDKAFFVMVGDGEDREKINNLIYKCGLHDKFLITGWVNNTNDYESCMDIGTLLTRWESFGLVIAEFMASGVPCIATNVDSVPELISHKKDGILIEVDNYRQMADSCIELYGNDILYQNIVKNGLHTVKTKFNIRREVEEHEKLFDSLLF